MIYWIHRLLRHQVEKYTAIGGPSNGERFTTCHTCGKTWGA